MIYDRRVVMRRTRNVQNKTRKPKKTFARVSQAEEDLHES